MQAPVDALVAPRRRESTSSLSEDYFWATERVIVQSLSRQMGCIEPLCVMYDWVEDDYRLEHCFSDGLLGPVEIQWKTGSNIHITAMVSQNVAHEPIMTHATRRIHKPMDSLVHPTFPSMGSYPHSGQVALLFLQRMNPMTAHRTMPLTKTAAVTDSPAHTAQRLAGNGGRMGSTVLLHRGQ